MSERDEERFSPVAFRSVPSRASCATILKVKAGNVSMRDEEEEQKSENPAELTTLVTVLAFDDRCVSIIFCQKYWRARK